MDTHTNISSVSEEDVARAEQVQRLILQFKEFYAGFSLNTIALLDEIYTQDLEFRDPVHTLHGSLALKGYFRRMAANMEHYRIHYLEEMTDSDRAYLSWEMEFRHKRLNGGSPVSVRGMTLIRFTAKIYFHEDSYDLGALVYEHVPILGSMTRLLKSRLSR